MVAKVKATKSGFTGSDSNISPEATLKDVIELKKKTGHSTMAVTENGEADGKLVGIVTSRDYRVSRMALDTKVKEFMTPFDKLIVGAKDEFDRIFANRKNVVDFNAMDKDDEE